MRQNLWFCFISASREALLLLFYSTFLTPNRKQENASLELAPLFGWLVDISRFVCLRSVPWCVCVRCVYLPLPSPFWHHFSLQIPLNIINNLAESLVYFSFRFWEAKESEWKTDWWSNADKNINNKKHSHKYTHAHSSCHETNHIAMLLCAAFETH